MEIGGEGMKGVIIKTGLSGETEELQRKVDEISKEEAFS